MINNSNNIQKKTIKFNPFVSSLIFSFCVSLSFIVAIAISVHNIDIFEVPMYVSDSLMPDFFTTSLDEMMFKVLIKLLIVFFITCETILLLQSAIIFVACRIFNNRSSDFLSILNIILKAFKLPIILLFIMWFVAPISLILAFFLIMISCIISAILLPVNLFQAIKENLGFSPTQALLTTPISLIINSVFMLFINTSIILSFITSFIRELKF